jgi:hypothetical protein
MKDFSCYYRRKKKLAGQISDDNFVTISGEKAE